jgi:hypothetical protein
MLNGKPIPGAAGMQHVATASTAPGRERSRSRASRRVSVTLAVVAKRSPVRDRLHRDQTVGVEADIDAAERYRSAHEQCSPHHEYHGHGHLDDDQRRVRQVLSAAARPGAGIVDRAGEIRSRGQDGRRETGDDAGDERDRDRERHDSPVEPEQRAGVAQARQPGCVDREQRTHAEKAHEQAERAARDAEQKPFH